MHLGCATGQGAGMTAFSEPGALATAKQGSDGPDCRAVAQREARWLALGVLKEPPEPLGTRKHLRQAPAPRCG